MHASKPDPDVAPRYPFAEWLDGRQWTLVRGRDFWGPPYVFAKRIRGAANARSLRVTMNFSDQGSDMTIQAVPRG